MAYQLLGAVAIVVGLVGTWFAARSRRGWLLCIASTVLWLPALTTGGQWTAVGNCALSIGICLRNFLVHPDPPDGKVEASANLQVTSGT